MIDLQGREYARIDQLKPGDVVQVDGDFTCMKPWSKSQVCIDDEGELYLHCSEGRHDLSGQLIDDSQYLMGVYKI